MVNDRRVNEILQSQCPSSATSFVSFKHMQFDLFILILRIQRAVGFIPPLKSRGSFCHSLSKLPELMTRLLMFCIS